MCVTQMLVLLVYYCCRSCAKYHTPMLHLLCSEFPLLPIYLLSSSCSAHHARLIMHSSSRSAHHARLITLSSSNSAHHAQLITLGSSCSAHHAQLIMATFWVEPVPKYGSQKMKQKGLAWAALWQSWQTVQVPVLLAEIWPTCYELQNV